MRWHRTGAFCWIAFLATAASTLSAGAGQPSETLLPATTKGFVSVTDTQQLSEHWNNSQLGKLIQDPVMKPFADDLRRQFEDRRTSLRKKLGLTLEDLKGVPSGELAVALVQPAEDQAAVVLLVDVTGSRDKALAMLDKVASKLVERGAQRTEATVLGTPVVVFDLPEPDADESAAGAVRLPPRAIYFLKDDLLVASDNPEVIKGILTRLDGGRVPMLAEVPTFQAVMERCQADAGEATPQVRWFLDPFGYVRAMRAAVPESDRRRGKTMLDHLEATGFTAVQALGGFVDVAIDGYELLHRTAIYAPRPYEKSMKMLDFPNAGQSEPPAWVPRDLAAYSTAYCNVLGAFDNFGPLFDEVIGEEGIWAQTLDGLIKAKYGPQIDLREELISQLGNQAIMITDYRLPITTTSERLLFAVQTKDPDAVAKAIKKNFEGDEGKEVRRREFEGHVIWETIPKERPIVQRVTIDVPPLGVGADQREEEAADRGEERPLLLPNPSVTVANGYLLVASHYDFLTEILQPNEERGTIGRSVDYLRVQDTINRLGGGKHFLRAFSRTDQEFRPTYELIRQGKMPESQTMLGRLLNTIFDVGKKRAIRKQQIDGSKLPDFEVVRRHLGPAGLFGTTEPNGWFLKGFTLPKETE